MNAYFNAFLAAEYDKRTIDGIQENKLNEQENDYYFPTDFPEWWDTSTHSWVGEMWPDNFGGVTYISSFYEIEEFEGCPEIVFTTLGGNFYLDVANGNNDGIPLDIPMRCVYWASDTNWTSTNPFITVLVIQVKEYILTTHVMIPYLIFIQVLGINLTFRMKQL